MHTETIAADQKYNAVVLAGSRRKGGDPLAEAGNVPHKCFIDIAGTPMLRLVVDAVLKSGRVKHVFVSINEINMAQARKILSPLGQNDKITLIPARANLGDSVAALVEQRPDVLPLVVTTGDNALHTAEMVKYFCDELDRSTGDGALGLTRAEVMLAKYPEGSRSFHRFRDGQFSSCNLYAILTEKAVRAAKTFNSGGQFAKKPWRLIFSFGLPAFLIYKSRLATIGGFLKALARPLKVKIDPVFMPFAEGPIDVDRVSDWKLANKIVAARAVGKSHAA